LEITDKGVRTQSGEVELDMLIFATGYDGLTGAMLAVDVQGRDGLRVSRKWSEGARSYLGIMMAGFPNLFMTTGPNGPAALANIIRISENDVDWIADAMRHMSATGQTAMEPTAEAEDGWMKTVAALSQRSLLNKAKTWYLGANVKDKPQGLSMFTGGFPKYREYCALATQDGYRAHFTFDLVKGSVSA
jgi:cation diffusion facilitator CzcD-associated flavoprotein CzcO